MGKLRRGQPCQGSGRVRGSSSSGEWGEGGDCGRADGAGREESGSAYGEDTQPQSWGCRGIGGFNPPQWKSGCGKVAMKARNMMSLSSRVEIIILQCSDLHLHLAAEGPSPQPETPRYHADRAALPPAELGQAESSRLAPEMESTSVWKHWSGDKEH